MSPEREPLTTRTALVLTVSDRSFEGTREDASGERLEERLAALGFEVERRVVPDEIPRSREALVDGAGAPPPRRQHRRARASRRAT